MLGQCLHGDDVALCDVFECDRLIPLIPVLMRGEKLLPRVANDDFAFTHTPPSSARTPAALYLRNIISNADITTLGAGRGAHFLSND